MIYTNTYNIYTRIATTQDTFRPRLRLHTFDWIHVAPAPPSGGGGPQGDVGSLSNVRRLTASGALPSARSPPPPRARCLLRWRSLRAAPTSYGSG